MTCTPGLAGEAQEAARTALAKWGLPVHEVTGEDSNLSALGMEFYETGVRVSPARRWRLRQAVAHIQKVKRLSGQELEILIGHFTYVFLLCRPCLAVFQSAYLYIRRYYTRRVHVWNTVLKELQWAADLLTMVEVRFDSPFNPHVMCTDSSKGGFGAHEGIWPVEAVRKSFEFSDRWRYRFAGGAAGCSARQAALQQWEHFNHIVAVEGSDAWQF
jgi:hypothetical protein